MSAGLIVLFSSNLLSYANKKGPVKAQPISVQVAKVTQKTLYDKLSAWGSLLAKQHANLASQVAGQVSTKNYADGYKGVQQGAVVLTLDSAAEKALVEADKVTVSSAKITLDANKTLFSEQAVSKIVELKARSDWLTAKATLAKDQVALDQKSIKAPFTGDLGEFKKNVGDYVNPGDTLVTLVNKKQLEVSYSLPEVAIPKIKLGQASLVKSSAYPKKTFVGKVTFISPAVDDITRTVTVKASLANPKEMLFPGMFVSVNQIINVQKNALIVPEEALQFDKNKASVFRVVGNKAVLTPVSLGLHREEGQVQVVKGLKLGDVVVTLGQEKLKNGNAVKITKPKKPAKTSATHLKRHIVNRYKNQPKTHHPS